MSSSSVTLSSLSGTSSLKISPADRDVSSIPLFSPLSILRTDTCISHPTTPLAQIKPSSPTSPQCSTPARKHPVLCSLRRSQPGACISTIHCQHTQRSLPSPACRQICAKCEQSYGDTASSRSRRLNPALAGRQLHTLESGVLSVFMIHQLENRHINQTGRARARRQLF